jgi:hypothetical protein
MKKVYLTVNYKAKVQVLEGANADELLDNAVILALDPDVLIVDSGVEESNVNVNPENPDFFDLDVRMKCVLEYSEGDLEDIVEGGLEFALDGLFSVWDWEVYGWGVEDAK